MQGLSDEYSHTVDTSLSAYEYSSAVQLEGIVGDEYSHSTVDISRGAYDSEYSSGQGTVTQSTVTTALTYTILLFIVLYVTAITGDSRKTILIRRDSITVHGVPGPLLISRLRLNFSNPTIGFTSHWHHH